MGKRIKYNENYRLRADFSENRRENVQMKERVIGVALKKGARELYVSGQIGQVGLLTPFNWITTIIAIIIVVIVAIMSPPRARVQKTKMEIFDGICSSRYACG